MIQQRLWMATFLLLAGAGLAMAQQSVCLAKLGGLPQVPELRGFRPGMTPEQVKARVPQIAFGRTDDLGFSQTTINPFYDPAIDKASFADVRTVSLDFLDGRISQVWIGYEATFKWTTIGEFVKGISQALAVPDQWTTKGRGQQLRCADFVLTVSPIAGAPSLRIADSAAEATLVARRQAKEDAAEANENGAGDTAVVGDSKTRTFFPADCGLLNSVQEKNRVKFNSSEEATKAGYKRAKDCP